MPRRVHAALLFLSLLWVSTGSAASVSILRLWPGFRTAESFESIGEYFGQPEQTRGRSLLRSQPNDRGGFYWLTRTQASEAIPHATVKLEVIYPGSTDAKAYAFQTAIPPGEHLFEIGATGTDWPGAKLRPVAWRLSFLDAQGTALVTQQSFLWSLP